MRVSPSFVEPLEARAHLSVSTHFEAVVGPLPAEDGSANTSLLVGPVPLSDPNPFYGQLESLDINTDTGEKPQSKVWEHDGSWFGCFGASGGTWVYRLDGDAWTQILKLSNTSSFRADAKEHGDVTHILLFNGSSSSLASIEYVSGTPGTYHLWSQRPTLTSVSLGSGVETATLDIDGYGRMWIAHDNSSAVLARWSDAPYTSFSS